MSRACRKEFLKEFESMTSKYEACYITSLQIWMRNYRNYRQKIYFLAQLHLPMVTQLKFFLWAQDKIGKCEEAVSSTFDNICECNLQFTIEILVWSWIALTIGLCYLYFQSWTWTPEKAACYGSTECWRSKVCWCPVFLLQESKISNPNIYLSYLGLRGFLSSFYPWWCTHSSYFSMHKDKEKKKMSQR